MNTTVLTFIIVFGVGGAFAAGVLLPKLFKGKAKEVAEEVEAEAEKVLPAATTTLTYAEKIGDAVSNIAPEPYKTIAATLPAVALEAVKQVQTIANAGVLTSDQRKTAATKIIETDLKNANITIDTNVEKLISVVIDTMCLAKSTALTSTTDKLTVITASGASAQASGAQPGTVAGSAQ